MRSYQAAAAPVANAAGRRFFHSSSNKVALQEHRLPLLLLLLPVPLWVNGAPMEFPANSFSQEIEIEAVPPQQIPADSVLTLASVKELPPEEQLFAQGLTTAAALSAVTAPKTPPRQESSLSRGQAKSQRTPRYHFYDILFRLLLSPPQGNAPTAPSGGPGVVRRPQQNSWRLQGFIRLMPLQAPFGKPVPDNGLEKVSLDSREETTNTVGPLQRRAERLVQVLLLLCLLYAFYLLLQKQKSVSELNARKDGLPANSPGFS